MPAYFGWDQIGTTRAISGTNEEVPPLLHEAAYTAFGEPVSSAGTLETRYGYAGAWGYETAESFDPLAELGWSHVGHRYYDPALGRFVQQDRIGIRGGLNVYAYTMNQPLTNVDPSGLTTWLSDWGEIVSLSGGVVAGVGGVTFLVSTCAVNPTGVAAGGITMGVGTVIWGIGSGMILADKGISWSDTWGRPHFRGPFIDPKPKPPVLPGTKSCLEGCHDRTRWGPDNQ